METLPIGALPSYLLEQVLCFFSATSAFVSQIYLSGGTLFFLLLFILELVLLFWFYDTIGAAINTIPTNGALP